MAKNYNFNTIRSECISFRSELSCDRSEFVLKYYIIFENDTHKLTNYYFHGHIQLLHNQTHN